MINPFNLLQTIGIGFLAVSVVVGVEEYRLHLWRVDYDELSAKYETCKTDLTTSKNNVKSLEDANKARNDAIEADAVKGRAGEAQAVTDANKALEGAKERKAQAAAAGTGPGLMNKFSGEVVK